MVSHEIAIEGVDLQGNTCGPATLLQMPMEDFPRRFLDDLAKMQSPATQLSTTSLVSPRGNSQAVLFQPVQRVLHVAMVQLACTSLMSPRLDPLRVESAGIVVRRLGRLNGVDQQGPSYQSWIKCPDGKFRWKTPLDEDADPTPALRPALKSGQPWLDAQLASLTISQASTEVFTPAFLAPPDTNTALGRTIAYAIVPTASSDVSDASQSVPFSDLDTLSKALPSLLSYSATAPQVPAKGASVDYKWLSDDYAEKQLNNNSFKIFSSALLMLFRQFNAFDSSPEASNILGILDLRNVTFNNSDGTTYTQPKGRFFKAAHAALIDFNSTSSAGSIRMPDSWEPLTKPDSDQLLPALRSALVKQGASLQPPEGRYQDPSRLYVARVFFRIKGHTPSCPSEIQWSNYTDIFRIAAWYESAQRKAAPIPLPDPTKRDFLKKATPNVSFAVPDGLMAAMQATTLKGLSGGSSSQGKTLNLNWICGFNIPLITICAFFVLNIFLILLNLVFFWLPFIKICIPIPTVAPASGDDNG